MLQSRKVYLALFGAIAWSSTAVDTILSILEAASFSSTQSSLVNIAAVASTFGVVSFCCIGLYTVHHVGNIRGALERSGQARNVLVSIIVFVSGVALLITLVLIIMIKSRWTEVTAGPTVAPISDWESHVSGQIAAWAISCVSQIALYSSPLWNDKAQNVQIVVTSGPRDSVMSEFRSSRPEKLNFGKPTRPLTPPSAFQEPDSLTALPSPTFSTRSSQSLKSFRDSLRHVVRPVTSRTTLISHRSFTRDVPASIYSNRQSIETVSQSDGFESWDTSSVSLPARESVLQQTVPYRGPNLEPIPGSRPNSPARALDGPFLSELPEEDDEELTPPPRMMPDISRPPSPAVSEAHIHPLFRSESPSGLPPPMATPGTSILASPLSSEAIACPPRMFNRMRSNSGRSQATVAPSIRQTRSFIRDPGASIRSMSRSPSPPSRAITPPIPDFVLNSSPRSSMSGSRKVSLRYSPNP
ncbi:UV excision repair [Pyrenophora seminiperda CCB06]|uniref:UV excision repair n=1 Tax=Pyrenophora seminiperda CCB06 TaxID=1302712 RepID=A0A3M7LYD5_9PLEO|nr:UV excision repair [Pyrenophora seminiperda CCB06]